jgi:hypothetical protein
MYELINSQNSAMTTVLHCQFDPNKENFLTENTIND